MLQEWGGVPGRRWCFGRGGGVPGWRHASGGGFGGGGVILHRLCLLTKGLFPQSLQANLPLRQKSK